MMLSAADIMTRDVVSARPDDAVAQVAKLMSDRGISAVPVCDEAGRPLGMLSEGDLMRPLGQEHALKRDWWLNLLAEGVDLAPAFLDYIRVDHRRARDLMIKPVITAKEGTSVPELADLLVRHRIKRVPIVREGKLVGVVSRADVVRALARTPDAIVEEPIC
jgi:CBS domain-containing protein